MADESTIGEFGENLKKIFNISAEDFASSVTRLTQSAVQVNQTFGQGRQRVIELQKAVADATPDIVRLGGQMSDVANVISQVSIASRRNVVATTEDVEKLFAAFKILGDSVSDIADSFLDVGYNISQVGKNLEDAIKYVQSIGGNSVTVVKTMRDNMDQLNRYQFEGGVKGLTKMAAQASMLRFDMRETFNLAERVLSPEGAIETAAAFQRLGVAAGNLVDPFQLMNQSINDPSGLQNSLADVAKQFTYFDEKTKTFKINPQGVLILKEMEQQTGVSAREMSKMGLAAAELDKRLSAVRKAGLVIASEEDKQFLANIARMGKGGEYEVKIKDDRGIEQTRKLSEITQNEFDKLIKEQKEGPQTLEELTRSQMGIQQIMQNDLRAIKEKVVGGISSAQQIGSGFEGLRRLTDVVAGEISKAGKTSDVRGKTEEFIGGLENLVKDLADPKNKNKFEVLSKYGEKFGNELDKMEGTLSNLLKETLEKAEKKIGTKTAAERYFKEGLGGFLGKEDADKIVNTINNTTNLNKEVKNITQQYGATASSKVEMGGKLVIDVNFNGAQNLSPEQLKQLQKVLYDKFNELNIQNYIVNVSQKPNANPTKAGGK